VKFSSYICDINRIYIKVMVVQLLLWVLDMWIVENSNCTIIWNYSHNTNKVISSL
jgi:hypothetical protein